MAAVLPKLWPSFLPQVKEDANLSRFSAVHKSKRQRKLDAELAAILHQYGKTEIIRTIGVMPKNSRAVYEVVRCRSANGCFCLCEQK